MEDVIFHLQALKAVTLSASFPVKETQEEEFLLCSTVPWTGLWYGFYSWTSIHGIEHLLDLNHKEYISIFWVILRNSQQKTKKQYVPLCWNVSSQNMSLNMSLNMFNRMVWMLFYRKTDISLLSLWQQFRRWMGSEAGNSQLCPVLRPDEAALPPEPWHDGLPDIFFGPLREQNAGFPVVVA